MNRRMVGGIFAAAVMAVSFAAHAIDRDFTVHNNINETIAELYVSPTSQTTWGSDILGRDVLPQGESAAIHFTPRTNAGECIFDIKLVAGAHQYVVSRVNLCTITDMTFNRSGSNVTFTTE